MSLIVICNICGSHTGGHDTVGWDSLWVKRRGGFDETHICPQCSADNHRLEDLNEG